MEATETAPWDWRKAEVCARREITSVAMFLSLLTRSVRTFWTFSRQSGRVSVKKSLCILLVTRTCPR